MLFQGNFIRSRALVERVKKAEGGARSGAATGSIAPRAKTFKDMCTRSQMDIADVMAVLARRIAEILLPQDKDGGVQELLKMMSAFPQKPCLCPAPVELRGACLSLC